MTVVVVMGASGRGKTTIAEDLARRLDVPFADADEFHPLANIEKMESGHPLSEDRPVAVVARDRDVDRGTRGQRWRPLQVDEPGAVVDITADSDLILTRCVAALRAWETG